MTPFPHLKQTSQEAGGTPGVKKFQRKLQMNFKEDFFLGHPVFSFRKCMIFKTSAAVTLESAVHVHLLLFLYIVKNFFLSSPLRKTPTPTWFWPIPCQLLSITNLWKYLRA